MCPWAARIATLLLLVSCSTARVDVPAGCEVMSDPAACAPEMSRHVELLAPGSRPAIETARYCGSVIRLANALQLYIDDPPDRHELLAGVQRVQGDNEALSYDPTACG